MIAIKDFKMPVDCSVCFGRGAIWCRFDESDRIVVPAFPDELFEGRPEWCPLIDVPDETGNCSEIPNNSDCVSILAAVEAIANQSNFSAEEIINICDKSVQDENGWLGGLKEAIQAVIELPSVQSETAKRIVGKSKDGMTLWYQCDMCNEPVDAQDNFCRGCGRRLTDGRFNQQTGC